METAIAFNASGGMLPAVSPCKTSAMYSSIGTEAIICSAPFLAEISTFEWMC
jgi:hypothetical protein